MGPEVGGTPIKPQVNHIPVTGMEITMQPNPMRNDIRFGLAHGLLPADTRVIIFDQHGTVVRTISSGTVPGLFQWNGDTREGHKVTQGVYYYLLETGGVQITGRIVKVQ
jgi:hypothetical protein